MGRVAYDIVRAFLAQSVERAAFNRKVVGSRPTGGVFYNKDSRVRKREKKDSSLSRYLQVSPSISRTQQIYMGSSV